MNSQKQLETNLQLRNAYPVRPGKRFVCFFVDFVLLSLVCYLLSLGFLPLFKNSSSYKASENMVQEEIQYYNQYISETHLVSFLDEGKTTRKDEDVLVLENISKAIYLSYKTYDEKLETPQFTDYVIKENSKLAKYGVASLTNDDISYFYTVYVPKQEYKVVTYQGDNAALYVYNLYKNSSISSYFSYSDINSLPILQSHIAYSLFVYLTEEKNDVNQSVYNDGESYYSAFHSTYSSFLTSAESLCIKVEPYYSTHYLVYRNALSNEGRLLNYALIVSLILSYLLTIVLPKLIFRHGQTFSRKIFSLYLADAEGKDSKWYYTLLTSFLGVFGYMPILSLFYMLPPFNGVFDSMFTPFIGNMSLVWIIVLPIFLLLVNYIPSLFYPDRETLLEMLFKVRLKDKRNQGESTDEEMNSGRDY